MENKKRTEISELGKFGLIEKLSVATRTVNPDADSSPADEASAMPCGQEYILTSQTLMLEGVDFDLIYFPLPHLGYKAVTLAAGKILASGAKPLQLSVSVGISAKLSVEDIEEVFEGIRAACKDYGIALTGIDAGASVNGLALALSCTGKVEKAKLVRQSGARPNDLICITGDLGAAYMGLHLLEREKRVLDGNPDPQPEFGGWEYLLGRQLRPSARMDISKELSATGITPTSMAEISDGLASDLLKICMKSDCGARIYLDRLPIASQTYKLAEELRIDPVVAALNGGDDHELLFTVPLERQAEIASIGGIDIIGHMTPAGTGATLVTPDGGEIPLSAPGIAI